jgi:Transposase DDE domain
MSKVPNCDLNRYTLFLIGQPHRVECTKLGNILNISHDSVNNFLLENEFNPKNLFDEIATQINLIGGVLSIDDTVIDKPFSHKTKTEYISWFYSGRHHEKTKGINLITMYYSDKQGNSVPINFRIYDPNLISETTGKTKSKNEYFQEMLLELLEWGLIPIMVTGDCWYGAIENLKLLRNKSIGFSFGLKSNRTVSTVAHEFKQIKAEQIPEEGLVTHLKEFGFIKVFKTQFKNEEDRYYCIWLPDENDTRNYTKDQFKTVHKIHWGIEQYHRAIKQLVGIDKFMVRKSKSIANHFFCSLRAICLLEFKRIKGEITDWYQIKRELYRPIVKEFILNNC